MKNIKIEKNKCKNTSELFQDKFDWKHVFFKKDPIKRKKWTG